jgi:hypothetical protein
LIAPAAAGERSERKPGRTWRAAASPLSTVALISLMPRPQKRDRIGTSVSS